MQPKSDAQLLREYAERGTESAFEEIVARHANLVYSAALRQVDSSDTAAEVAQSTFVALTHAVRSFSTELKEDASVAGWLCRTARNISLKFRRDEFRRRARERQAMATVEPAASSSLDWEHLCPVLDEAMSELNETDYDALVMRFFNNQDLRSVGHALGVSDDAAQKRVSRALDKLRDLLCKRGIQTTAAALSVVISANAVHAGPGGLVASISKAALLSGAAATAVAGSTALKTTAMTTLSKTIVITTVTIFAGAGLHQARQASKLREEVQTLQRQQAPLAEQNQQLARERDGAVRQMTALREDNERLNRNADELVRLRGEVTRLRNPGAGASSAMVATSSANTPPKESAPIVSGSTPEMAWAYAQLRRKAAGGVALSPGEEVHLAKAWLFLKELQNPDQFGLFQANYIAEMLGVQDQDIRWRIRQILETARETEHARGLKSARMLSEEQLWRDLPPGGDRLANLPPAALERYHSTLEQWRELDQKARGEINAILPTEVRSAFDTSFPTVLNFDMALKSDPAQAQANPEFTDLTVEQVWEGWPKRPGSSYVRIPAKEATR